MQSVDVRWILSVFMLSCSEMVSVTRRVETVSYSYCSDVEEQKEKTPSRERRTRSVLTLRVSGTLTGTPLGILGVEPQTVGTVR